MEEPPPVLMHVARVACDKMEEVHAKQRILLSEYTEVIPRLDDEHLVKHCRQLEDKTRETESQFEPMLKEAEQLLESPRLTEELRGMIRTLQNTINSLIDECWNCVNTHHAEIAKRGISV